MRVASGLEALETRVVLSATPGTIHPWAIPPFAPVAERVVPHGRVNISQAHPIGSSPRQISFLDNDGKVLTGKDREGDEWSITVHGPGAVIVTDATPNDGSLDDDLNTIQLVGTDPRRTYVTGQTTASARVLSDGIVKFNHLISIKGVKSIILNGFTLTRTVDNPDGPNNAGNEIFLPGGVGTLSFQNINAEIDLAGNAFGPDQPFDIVIGQPNSPLRQRPNLYFGQILNTVFDSSQTSQANLGPQTNPTINIVVNGRIHVLQAIAATADPVDDGLGFNFPLVDVTGRTSIQTLGIDRLKIIGSARNFTVSRTPTPFRGAFSGIDQIGHAEFGGNADAVGLDVAGPIRRLKFYRGLGSPVGAQPLPQNYGYNEAKAGYPSRGLLGGLVTATKIGKITAGPANLVLQTTQDPDYIQSRQGSTRFYSQPGYALTGAAITSAGSIQDINIIGSANASEIATGFDYPSYVAGLEPVRAPSKIGRIRMRGSLVDSVISATYRPQDSIYGNNDDVAGPGSIHGHFQGVRYVNGSATALNNRGVGFFAKNKSAKLPPPDQSLRRHGVLIV